jgi:hypothetical protein
MRIITRFVIAQKQYIHYIKIELEKLSVIRLLNHEYI